MNAITNLMQQITVAINPIKTAKEDSIRSRVEVNFAYPALFYTDTSLKSYQTH